MIRSREKYCHKTVYTMIFMMMALFCYPLFPETGWAVTTKTIEKESNESRIVYQIEQGERNFLYPLGDDGYLYPVLVEEALFIESMPMKIKVKLFSQQRTVAVPVRRLQEHPSCPKVMNLEIRAGKQWKAVQGGHRFQQQYLGKMDGEELWRVLSDELVRIKVNDGGKK